MLSFSMFALNLDGFPPPISPTPSAPLGISASSTSFTSPTSSTSRLSAHAQQRPQPQSPHTLTSQLSGYPGVGGISSLSMPSASVPSALKSTRPSALSPFVTILDAASSLSPVFATLTKNTGGGVSPLPTQ